MEAKCAIETPKPIYTELLHSMLPILTNLKKEYISQLGENHEYIQILDSFIESHSIKLRKRGVEVERETFWTSLLKMGHFRKRVTPTINLEKDSVMRDEAENSAEYLLSVSLKDEEFDIDGP